MRYYPDEMTFHQFWLYQPHIQELYYHQGQCIDGSSCEYRLAIGNEWLTGPVTLAGV